MSDDMKGVTQENQPQDLMDYLYRAWKALGRQDSIEVDGVLVEFLKHSRQTLAENQPVGTDYMGKSFALRLQDGTIVPVVDAENPSTGGVAGSVDITKIQGKGKDRTAPSPSWGVTGDGN